MHTFLVIYGWFNIVISIICFLIKDSNNKVTSFYHPFHSGMLCFILAHLIK